MTESHSGGPALDGRPASFVSSLKPADVFDETSTQGRGCRCGCRPPPLPARHRRLGHVPKVEMQVPPRPADFLQVHSDIVAGLRAARIGSSRRKRPRWSAGASGVGWRRCGSHLDDLGEVRVLEGGGLRLEHEAPPQGGRQQRLQVYAFRATGRPRRGPRPGKPSQSRRC